MAGQYNLKIDKGAYWCRTMYLTENGVAVNLTGYTAKAQIRPFMEGPLELELSTPSSGITITAAEGKIFMEILEAVTGALTIEDGVWALELTDGAGKTTRLLEGDVEATPQVVR